MKDRHIDAEIYHSCLSLLGCELITVAFRSAKVASINATFAEQKATIAKGDYPITSSSSLYEWLRAKWFLCSMSFIGRRSKK
jgi:hypothetical protein